MEYASARLFDYANTITAQAISAYLDEQAGLERRDESSRMRAVTGLLQGDLDPRMAERSIAYRLDASPHRLHAVGLRRRRPGATSRRSPPSSARGSSPGSTSPCAATTAPSTGGCRARRRPAARPAGHGASGRGPGSVRLRRTGDCPDSASPTARRSRRNAWAGRSEGRRSRPTTTSASWPSPPVIPELACAFVEAHLGPLSADDEKSGTCAKRCGFSSRSEAVRQRPPRGCGCTRTPSSNGSRRSRNRSTRRSTAAASDLRVALELARIFPR